MAENIFSRNVVVKRGFPVLFFSGYPVTARSKRAINLLIGNMFKHLLCKINKMVVKQNKWNQKHISCIHVHLQNQIKAMTALVGRLSLSVGWKKSPERGLKTVSFNH